MPGKFYHSPEAFYPAFLPTGSPASPRSLPGLTRSRGRELMQAVTGGGETRHYRPSWRAPGSIQSHRADLPRGRSMEDQYRTRCRQMNRRRGGQTAILLSCIKQWLPGRGEVWVSKEFSACQSLATYTKQLDDRWVGLLSLMCSVPSDTF